MKINFLDELGLVLKRHNIQKKDVCIVGSAVMTAMGMRENRDIDIILKKSVRDSRFGLKCERLSDNIELVSSNWFCCDEELTDDEIIDNNLYHSVIDEYKFVNLNILKKRKQASRKEKDKTDILLIKDES